MSSFSNFRITSMKPSRTRFTVEVSPPSDEHDLVIAYNKFAAAKKDQKRSDQLSKFVYKTSARAPIDKVVPLWNKSIGKTKNAPFALAVARAAPFMITKADRSDVGRIYGLLRDTIAKLPEPDKEKAADALLRAVLRTPGEVPPEARRVIRQLRTTLKKYPEVWRYIGSFEA